jgi:hypothetical protein
MHGQINIKNKEISLYQEIRTFFTAQGKDISLKMCTKIISTWCMPSDANRNIYLCSKIYLQHVSARICHGHVVQNTKKLLRWIKAIFKFEVCVTVHHNHKVNEYSTWCNQCITLLLLLYNCINVIHGLHQVRYSTSEPLSRNLGTLTSWNPLGHPRPEMGLLLPDFRAVLRFCWARISI